jgi:hypothetical protein
MADRIEREIEEILRKLDNVSPGAKKTPRIRKSGARPLGALQSWLAHSLARISLNQVMMWSLIAFIASFFLMRVVPGASWVMIGSLILFGTAFQLSRSRGSSPKPATEKRWRGQAMDLSDPSFADRLKAWLKGKKRRRV